MGPRGLRGREAGVGDSGQWESPSARPLGVCFVLFFSFNVHRPTIDDSLCIYTHIEVMPQSIHWVGVVRGKERGQNVLSRLPPGKVEGIGHGYIYIVFPPHLKRSSVYGIVRRIQREELL